MTTLYLNLGDPHDAYTYFKRKQIFRGGIGTYKISIDIQHATTVAAEVYTKLRLHIHVVYLNLRVA